MNLVIPFGIGIVIGILIFIISRCFQRIQTELRLQDTITELNRVKRDLHGATQYAIRLDNENKALRAERDAYREQSVVSIAHLDDEERAAVAELQEMLAEVSHDTKPVNTLDAGEYEKAIAASLGLLARLGGPPLPPFPPTLASLPSVGHPSPEWDDVEELTDVDTSVRRFRPRRKPKKI